MPRKPRIEFPGALYHVIARGNNRQKIFLGEKDYSRFLARLKLYKKKFNFILYSYAFMPNHIHLLIEASDVPLSQIMQPLELSYTQYFNLVHGRVGHLFQGRYKAILCQKDAYLMELIRYIILNPVRSGLAKHVADWQWCSYSDITGQKNDPVTSIEDVLGLFGKKRKHAFESLQKFLNDGLSGGHREEYYNLKDQRVLGDSDFAEEAIQREMKDFEHYNITVGEAVHLVSKYTGVEVEEISSSCRGRHGSRARGIVAYICKNVGGLASREISRYFKRSDAMISRLLNWIRVERNKDQELNGLLSKIEKEIKLNFRPLLVRMAVGK